MTSIEETGKDVEEATQRALEQLGVTEDEVDVEILDEGTRGFLGLGQTPAKVRVAVKELPKPAAPKARKPRRKRPSEPKPEAGPAAEAAPREAPAEPAPEAQPAPQAQPPASEEVVQQAAEISRETLQRVLDGTGLGGKATVASTADAQVVLDMVGGDTAILIGKYGQTINALQYLVGIITNRHLSARVRIILDAEGYRGRREEALRNQALHLADKVKESGQEAVLEALHANERRIIHLSLVDDPDIYTYSEGEEPERHVVISPKK